MHVARIDTTDEERGPVVNISNRRDKFLRVYHELRVATTPYVINFGSGGSGKSYANAQYLVKRIFAKKEKLLIIRKFATSLNDSVIAQMLEEALPFWGFKEGSDYKYNKTSRTLHTANGSKVLFRGLDKAEKFKSIAGITIVWIEEATEISKKEFMILDDRIRGEPQVFLTYNPISERHWLKSRFHHPQDPYKRGVNSNVTMIFSTYMDNPFVGEKYRQSMEWYRVNEPDHYAVYGLGKFGVIRPESPYFTAYKPINVMGTPEFDTDYPFVHLSWDFNVKNTCLVSQHFEGPNGINCVNYLDVIHGEGDLQDMCKAIAQKFRYYQIMFTGDASGNNGSALTTGNATAWSLIQKYFMEAGANYLDFSRVPTANPSTATSRHYCNALISYFNNNIQIHREHCSLLLDDLERCQTTSIGDLDKIHANKNDYGHASDCFRYDLAHFEYSTYLTIGISQR